MELEKFKNIVLPLQEKLYSVAIRMLSNSEDAPDVVQEIFLRLWKNRVAITQHSNIGGYAIQTFKNICLDKNKLRKENISLESIHVDSQTDSPYIRFRK